jgi:flagellar basal body-associated protein FliL
MGRQSKGFSEKVGRGWNRLWGRDNSQPATATKDPPNSNGNQPTTGPLGSNSGDILGDLFDGKQQPHGNGNGHSPLQEGGTLNLVNYRPEELVKQVDSTLSRVHFGMSKSRRYWHMVGDIWANIGPWVLLTGTVGEVFAFIWITTTNNDPKNNPAWWVAVSILATVISLEFTFMVVSFKSAATRNDAEHRPTGFTDRDKKILREYRLFWFILALFVGVGQVAFLVEAMTQNFTHFSSAFILLVVFAILRTIGTLVSDFYTAFSHKETPTTAEQAKAEQEERADMSAKLLRQKSQEVTIINDGIQTVMRAQSKGEIEQDDLRTELRLKKMENQNRIGTMQAQADNAQLMTRLGNNLLRAIFDDQLPDTDRQRILQGIQGLLQMNQQLPPGYRVVREEKEDDDRNDPGAAVGAR